MEPPRPAAEMVKLLQQRIDESGLSARRFAYEVLLRDERTIRRWIAMDSPIPQVVADWLVSPKPFPWPPAETAGDDERIE